jgi:hypothetical protein
LKTDRPSARAGYGLHWDEKSITEHDIDRGTRQKIVEPKTPYHTSRDDMEDSDPEDDVLQQPLRHTEADSKGALHDLM